MIRTWTSTGISFRATVINLSNTQPVHGNSTAQISIGVGVDLDLEHDVSSIQCPVLIDNTQVTRATQNIRAKLSGLVFRLPDCVVLPGAVFWRDIPQRYI